MQNGASILSAHVVPPAHDFAILGDQRCPYRHTTLSGAFFGLLDSSDETGILLHCVVI